MSSKIICKSCQVDDAEAVKQIPIRLLCAFCSRLLLRFRPHHFIELCVALIVIGILTALVAKAWPLTIFSFAAFVMYTQLFFRHLRKSQERAWFILILVFLALFPHVDQSHGLNHLYYVPEVAAGLIMFGLSVEYVDTWWEARKALHVDVYRASTPLLASIGIIALAASMLGREFGEMLPREGFPICSLFAERFSAKFEPEDVERSFRGFFALFLAFFLILPLPYTFRRHIDPPRRFLNPATSIERVRTSDQKGFLRPLFMIAAAVANVIILFAESLASALKHVLNVFKWFFEYVLKVFWNYALELIDLSWTSISILLHTVPWHVRHHILPVLVSGLATYMLLSFSVSIADYFLGLGSIDILSGLGLLLSLGVLVWSLVSYPVWDVLIAVFHSHVAAISVLMLSIVVCGWTLVGISLIWPDLSFTLGPITTYGTILIVLLAVGVTIMGTRRGT